MDPESLKKKKKKELRWETKDIPDGCPCLLIHWEHRHQWPQVLHFSLTYSQHYCQGPLCPFPLSWGRERRLFPGPGLTRAFLCWIRHVWPCGEALSSTAPFPSVPVQDHCLVPPMPARHPSSSPSTRVPCPPATAPLKRPSLQPAVCVAKHSPFLFQLSPYLTGHPFVPFEKLSPRHLPRCSVRISLLRSLLLEAFGSWPLNARVPRGSPLGSLPHVLTLSAHSSWRIHPLSWSVSWVLNLWASPSVSLGPGPVSSPPVASHGVLLIFIHWKCCFPSPPPPFHSEQHRLSPTSQREPLRGFCTPGLEPLLTREAFQNHTLARHSWRDRKTPPWLGPCSPRENCNKWLDVLVGQT